MSKGVDPEQLDGITEGDESYHQSDQPQMGTREAVFKSLI